MHCVYLIEFVTRKVNGIYPFYYIGSKSNCIFDGTNIIDQYGKRYYGSSKAEGYTEALQNSELKVSLLYSSDDYTDCLKSERRLQIHHDVVADPRYWNQSLATESNYADPNYATYKHITAGKVVRLPRDHPMVISGMYVGITAGSKTYNNGEIQRQFYDGEDTTGWVPGVLESTKRIGEHNGFYGKTHTDETIEKAKKSIEEFWESNPEYRDQVREAAAIRTGNLFRGVPKTKESNEKRGRKGMVMLTNVKTGETIRIHKSAAHEYDGKLWRNPFSIASESYPEITCPHCGKISKSPSNMKRWHFDNCKEKK